jgi:phosphatidylglycerol:prolipoprotein diacylglycerol transferase
MNDAAGVARWPAVPAEVFFNVLMLAGFLAWRGGQKFTGQHFHIYLIAYGLFRFLHEFLRDCPRWSGSISGYHLAALLVATWGFICFRRRQAQVSLPLYADELIHTT